MVQGLGYPTRLRMRLQSPTPPTGWQTRVSSMGSDTAQDCSLTSPFPFPAPHRRPASLPGACGGPARVPSPLSSFLSPPPPPPILSPLRMCCRCTSTVVTVAFRDLPSSSCQATPPPASPSSSFLCARPYFGFGPYKNYYMSMPMVQLAVTSIAWCFRDGRWCAGMHQLQAC